MVLRLPSHSSEGALVSMLGIEGKFTLDSARAFWTSRTLQPMRVVPVLEGSRGLQVGLLCERQVSSFTKSQCLGLTPGTKMIMSHFEHNSNPLKRPW